MMKGTCVVDEIVCRIEDIFLRDGMIYIICTAEAPPDHKAGVTDMRLYGVDGKECGVVRTWVPKWEGVTGTLTIQPTILLTEMVGSNE